MTMQLNASPATDPRSASSRLSVKSCREIRLRLAPIAMRMPISRSREMPRAIIRPPKIRACHHQDEQNQRSHHGGYLIHLWSHDLAVATRLAQDVL